MPEIQRQRAAPDHDRACRELEASVHRIAKFVLHASALADRMDTLAPTDVVSTPDRPQRQGALRAAVAAGQQSIPRIVGASLAEDVPQARVPHT